MERRGRDEEARDVFHMIPSSRMVIWPELNRLPMYVWCQTKVFIPHQPSKVLLEDKTFLFSLAETEICVMVGRQIPIGAFAECTLPLDEEEITAAAVLSRCENLDNGAFYRAQFTLMDKALGPRLREFLLHERARRMQSTGTT